MRIVKLICAAALCSAIFSVGTAHAWEWSIKGKGLEELKVKSESLEISGSLVLLTTAFKLTLVCESVEAEGFSISPSGRAKVAFESGNCFLSGNLNCTVEPFSLQAEAEIVERSGGEYLALGPSAELATIFLGGPKCVLPEENVLSGSIAAELESGESATRSLLFSESAAKAVGTTLFFAGENATLGGELTASLSGAHAGESWGFLAPTTGLGPGTELNFTGQPAGATKIINVENVGLPLSNVTMEDEWIEEGGVKSTANFEIIPTTGAEPCPMPAGTSPFETLVGKGAKCNVKIKFKGAAGKHAFYVLEYGPYLIWASKAKFPLNS